MKGIIQQGDVLFFPTKQIPKNAKKVVSKKHHILVEGEATGHAHRVSVDEVDFYKTDNQMFVILSEKSAHITHEEHKTKELTDPMYEVKVIREYDYDLEEARRVAD